MDPRTSPTLTSSSAFLSMDASTPAASAATSKFAFSVSSSTTVSPSFTASPSPRVHLITVASITESPRWGTTMFLAIFSSLSFYMFLCQVMPLFSIPSTNSSTLNAWRTSSSWLYLCMEDSPSEGLELRFLPM